MLAWLPSLLLLISTTSALRTRQHGLGIPNTNAKVLANIETKWFTQKLDHFQTTDNTTWQQRYFVNEEFFNNSTTSPVFILIGGEGEISDKWMTAGAWYKTAERNGALLIQLEHRFYGESHPTEDLSTENMRYLTTQQALQDLATFITATNAEYHLTDTNKWIAFGGSYPGTLAAWLRLKYPHLVHGAMSASSPLLAIADFMEYHKVVRDSLATFSDSCPEVLASATKELSKMIEEGNAKVDELFSLCEPIEKLKGNPKHVANLFEVIADQFAGVVQYNKDNRISQDPINSITIDDVCTILDDTSRPEPINRLAAVISSFLNATDSNCLDYNYDSDINDLRNTSWDSEAAEGMRQWIYQTCYEFGWFQTSSFEPEKLWGDHFDVNFFKDQCYDIFGLEFDQQQLENTNTVYGGLDIIEDNVVFVHGTIDPWHAIGLNEAKNGGVWTILIKGTAHCANMYPDSDDDLPQLKAARVQVDKLIDSWLAD